jgi:hypothetical protein
MKYYCQSCGKYWEQINDNSWKYIVIGGITGFFSVLLKQNLEVKKCKVCIKLKEKKEVIIHDTRNN